MKKIFLSCISLLFLSLCSNIEAPKTEQSPSSAVLFVHTSDFSTGSYSTLTLGPPFRSYSKLGFTHSDAISKYNSIDEKVYVINRLGSDSVQVLDPNLNFETTREFALESGSNPQDMVFLSLEKAYVSLYEKPYILIINPKTGKKIGKIDLSSYSDPDGVPEAHQFFLHSVGSKTYLYLTLQRLNRFNLFKPTDYSLLLIIDPFLDIVVHALKLKGTNPNSKIIYSPLTGNLHFSSLGNYGRYYSLDGGIESITPNEIARNTVVNEFLFSEKELNGEVSDFAILADGSFYAILTDNEFNSYFIKTSINDKASRQILYSVRFDQGGYLSALEVFNGEYIFLADRILRNSGIWVYDILSGSFDPDSPVDLGLPPASMTIIP